MRRAGSAIYCHMSQQVVVIRGCVCYSRNRATEYSQRVTGCLLFDGVKMQCICLVLSQVDTVDSDKRYMSLNVELKLMYSKS